MSAQTGSMMNYLMMNSESATPEIGAPATVCMWSDRHAMTVTRLEFFKSGARAGQLKAVYARRDHAKRMDLNGMSDSQTYEFSYNENAREDKFVVKKNGELRGEYGSLIIGFKSEFYDFTR
jgi:hypothetical protein